MSHKLFQTNAEGPISPLIDVVVNGMAALFIILMVYMLLARPSGEPERLRFLSGVEPPPVIAGQSYVFTFPVTGGRSGNRRFEIEEGDLPPGLELDATTGTLYGISRPPSPHGDVGGEADGRDTTMTQPYEITLRVEGGGDMDRRTTVLIVYPAAVPYHPYDPPFNIVRRNEELPTGRIGVAYEEVLGGRGGVRPYQWTVSGGRLPQGLRLEDGIVQGIPGASGRFTFTARIDHSPASFSYRNAVHRWRGGTSERRFRLRILPSLKASLQLPEGRVGEPYLGSMAADGLFPEDVIQWQGLPSGLSPAGDGRTLLGVPEQPGTFHVSYVIEGKDVVLGTGESEVRFLPPRPRVMAATLAARARRGEELRILLSYRGLREPVVARPVALLPAGLKLEGATLVGRPETVGRTEVPFVVEDAAGVTARGRVLLTVTEPPVSLSIETPKRVALLSDRPVDFRLVAAGGEGDYTWHVRGTLPPGLKLTPAGRLTGHLAASGSWSLDVEVQDRVSGESVRRRITLEAVRPDPSRPRLVTAALPPALAGSQYRVDLAAEGGIGGYRWRFGGDLPTGLDFTDTGVAGRPALESTGEWPVTVAVADEAGTVSTPETLVIEVVEPVSPLPAYAGPLPPATVGVEYRAALPPNGCREPCSWQVADLPPGLQVVESSLTGIAEAPGTYRLTATWTSEAGRETKTSFDLEVRSPRPDPNPSTGPMPATSAQRPQEGVDRPAGTNEEFPRPAGPGWVYVAAVGAAYLIGRRRGHAAASSAASRHPPPPETE